MAGAGVAATHIITDADWLYALREFGAARSGDRQVQGCGRRIRLDHPGSARGVLDRFVECRRIWLCATCANRDSRRQAVRFTWLLRRWAWNGGAICFLTLTHRHSLGQALLDLWGHRDAGWAEVVRGAGWRTDRRRYGVRSYVSAVEVVHHPMTGWNVHTHVLLFVDGRLDPPALANLKTSMVGRYRRGVERCGGHVDDGGQDLQLMRDGTEAALADYVTKGIRARWSPDGSRSPMAILADYREHDDRPVLWEEYVPAVTYRRRQHLTTTKRIETILPDRTAVPS